MESFPVGIEELNVYIVNRKDEKDLKECLRDGRKWKKDCRGSYKCNNSKCPFLTEYGVKNTKQWRK